MNNDSACNDNITSQHLSNEQGATMVEYAVALALIVMIITPVVLYYTPRLENKANLIRAQYGTWDTADPY